MSGGYTDDLFRRADQLGLVVESFTLDGAWHRVPVTNARQKNNEHGAYCLSEFHLRSGAVVAVGLMCNWRSGEEQRLTLEGVEASPEEMADARRRMAEAAERSKAAKAAEQEAVAQKALGVWNKLPAEGKSAYLDRKRVHAWGVRFSRGAIVVPACDVAGKLWTLQFIYPEKNERGMDKIFLTGGAKRGRFHLIGEIPAADRFTLGVAEGYATAASIYEAIGKPIAVAFDAGNLLPVALALRDVYPGAAFVFFADHDRNNGYPQAFIRQSDATPAVLRLVARLARVRPDVLVEVVADDDARLRDRERGFNVGVSKAIIAAGAVDGVVVAPDFEGV